MGWFDEQIKQRMQSDDQAFADAFAQMAEVVTGEKASLLQQDAIKRSRSAIEAILLYFHVKPQELQGEYTTVSDLLEALLKPHGIMHRAVTLRGAWYREGIGVLLGSTQDGETVALLPRGLGGYQFFDQRAGKYVKITRKNADQFQNEAFCFYQPLPLESIRITSLLRYLAHIPAPADVAMIVCCTLLVTLLGLWIPKMNNLIFSHIILTEDTVWLVAAMLFLVGITIANALIGVIRTLWIQRIQTKMDVSIESASMMRVLSLPASFFKQYSAGNIGSRMKAIGMLCSLLSDVIFTTGLNSLFSLVYVTQILRYAPALLAPALLLTGATFLLTLVCALWQAHIGTKLMKEQAKEQGMIYSMFSGIQKIKLAGAEKRFFARWANQYVKSAKLSYAPPKLIRYQKALTTAIGAVGTVILYVVAIRGHVSVADYMAFNTSYAMITGAFSALAAAALSIANIKPILDLARPIMEAVPETAEGKKTIERLSGGIELSHVSFRYAETMPEVLHDLSLKIRPGQYVAIVGSTGCGKSTLMRLMLGLETPDKGAVYYDSRDLATLDLQSLRRHIGVVLQDGKLFQGDIFSNIIISAPNLTLDDAWQAAEMAGMAEDIWRMPMGMHTLISEGGGGISGGQRQRLLIARAIAPRPKILLFDEATSALDNITQKVVSDSLEKLRCTRIVIAHRLSTIQHCDRIVVLDQGQIIEDGTYEELLAKQGFFARLVARQQIDSET